MKFSAPPYKLALFSINLQEFIDIFLEFKKEIAPPWSYAVLFLNNIFLKYMDLES